MANNRMRQQELINHESLPKSMRVSISNFASESLIINLLRTRDSLTIYYMKESSSSSMDVNVYFQSYINFIIDPK